MKSRKKCQLIYKYYFDGVDLSDQEAYRLSRYLHKAREQEFWLTCGCRDKEPAAFTIKVLQESIFISTIPTRSGHEKGCRFGRVPVVRKQPAVNKPDNFLKPGKVLNLHRKSPGLSTVKEEHYSTLPGGASYKTPRLLRILWELIEASGLDAVNVRPAENQLEEIKHSTRPYFLLI